jgi:hypothetical protein
LQPQHAEYLDTLAEVEFRRGNTAEAVRIEETLAKPDGLPIYKTQLERFQKTLGQAVK